MRPINGPLTLGQTGDEVVNLQDVLLALFNAGTVTYSDLSIIDKLHEEQTRQFLGSATAQLIGIFRNAHNIPAGDQVLSQQAADALNTALADLQPTALTISGFVSHVSGKPVAGGCTAELYYLAYPGPAHVGTVTVADDGTYACSFNPVTEHYAIDPEQINRFDVLIKKTDQPDYNPEDPIVLGTATIQASGRDIRLDVRIDSAGLALVTEYSAILAALTAVTDDPLANMELNEQTIQLLAGQTRENSLAITDMIKAFKLHDQIAGGAAQLTPAIFYGLLRQHLPDGLVALSAQPGAVLIQALKVATVTGIIPGMSDDEIAGAAVAITDKILAFLMAHPAADGGFYRIILQTADGDTDIATDFIKAFLAAPAINDAFWGNLQLGGQTAGATLKARLKTALQLAALTGNNAPVAIRLMKVLSGAPASGDPSLTTDNDIDQPELLTQLTGEDWAAIVSHTYNDGSFVLPAGLDPADADEVAGYLAAYAASLQAQTLGSYAAHAVAYGLQGLNTGDHLTVLKDNLDTFLANNIGFDFRTTPVSSLSSNALHNMPDAFRAQLGIVQRLLNVTTDVQVINQLAEDGLHSSLQIAGQPAADFVASYENVAGSADAARDLYDKATGNVMFLMNSVLEAKQAQLDPTFSIFNGTIGGGGVYASWGALFGTLDGCNCSQCQSVYSPGAYLVDLLHFLKAQLPDVHDELMARRPDIKDIELTCKNINTPVPHIDIVNELLEDLVGYNTAYDMDARQTKADAATQRAMPEYVRSAETGATAPCQRLKAAAYPWSLPYNIYQRQIGAHLDLAHIKGAELVQRFGPDDRLEAWDNVDYCRSYLDLSETAYQHIVNQAGISAAAYYGLKDAGSNTYAPVPNPAVRGASYPAGPFTQGAWVATIGGRIDVFLQQAGITHAELMTLLDCYTINPEDTSRPGNTRQRKILPLRNTTDVSEDTCDLSKLRLDGITEEALNHIHRFVRMQRTLGWSAYELDKALQAFPAPVDFIDEDLFKKLAQLHRLSGLLHLPVADVCLFWRDLDVKPYRDYGSEAPVALKNEYEQVFRNPLLGNVAAGDYPFPETLATTVTVDYKTFTRYLSGILNLHGADIDGLLPELLLTPDSNGNIDIGLARLSLIRRNALLMKGLKLDAAAHLFYKDHISEAGAYGSTNSGNSVYNKEADPFSTPFAALRFAAFAGMQQAARLKLTDTQYILEDRQPDSIQEAKHNQALEKMLTDLRSGLKQRALPEYTAADDAHGLVLKELLLSAMNVNDAGQLLDIVQHTVNTNTDPDDGYTDAELAFMEDALVFFLPAGDRAKLMDYTNSGTYLTSPAARHALVFSALKEYVTDMVLKPFVTSFLVKELKLKEEIVTVLLDTSVLDNAQSAMTWLLDDDFIQSQGQLLRWPVGGANTSAQFRALLLLDKAALIIRSFKLELTDVQHLWQWHTLPEIIQLSALPVKLQSNAALTPAPFRKWLSFLRWMGVRAFLGKDMVTLYEGIQALPGSASDAAIGVMQNNISVAFKTNIDDIFALLGNVTTAGSLAPGYATYKTPQLYLRLIDCLELQHRLPATMETLTSISDAVLSAGTQDDANEVIQTVKSQYDDRQWLEAIRPVNDRLRTERRDALVAWLLANPPAGYTHTWLTPEDIYETLMVDVEMMSCMSTTRVLLAVNTVQLWVDRVLLGLETHEVMVNNQTVRMPYALTPRMARQWHLWRKLYRVWEANRKVFIYPENWIEPELRDDKSPFFLELEKFLKQNELTEDNVADAYQTYLERLEEVAHLDIIGHYPQVVKDSNGNKTDTIMHVWGRTRANPHIYYYRTRIGGIWNTWTKMEVQIDSDNIAPVLWKGRLQVYWLTFTEAQKDEQRATPDGQSPYFPEKYWKIELNWTELKNGKWQSRQIGRDALRTQPYGPMRKEDIFFNRDKKTDYWLLSWTPDTFRDSFEFLKNSMLPYGLVNDQGDLEIVVHGRRKYVRQIDINAAMKQRLANPTESDYYTLAEEYYYQTPLSDNYQGRFTVKAGKVYTDANFPHTFFDTLVEAFPLSPEKSRYRYVSYNIPGGIFRPSIPASFRYINGPSSNDSLQLLGTIPSFPNAPAQEQFLLLSRMVPENANPAYFPFPSFFYQDYKHTFFVEQQQLPTGNVILPIGNGNTSGSGIRVIQPYQFYSFSHERVSDFRERLFDQGLDGLLSRDFITGLADTLQFGSTYAPTGYVAAGTGNSLYPTNTVRFDYTDANAQYNWELFFHIPMLIANKLMQDQKFEEARKWYHYVFNPTAGGADSAADFWNYPVFYDKAAQAAVPVDLMQDPGLTAAVSQWADNPFKPHLVARTRVTAYMKNTVMKYLDNLIGWADTLFRTDTRENINEATLLYVLAARIMGRRPAQLSARAIPQVQTYSTLDQAGLNAFSNALVAMEQLLMPSGVILPAGATVRIDQNGNRVIGNPATTPTMFYFCIPPNSKMLGYWDTLADRLFKIRNCRNIDGVERDLALYDPPIDPALLVQAGAAGISLATALADINAPLPLYRFSIMSQKATELAQEVTGLGSQLLSALEKKDGEALSLLRSSQELTVMDLVTEVREQQVQDAVTQVNGLQQQQRMVTQRRDYYQKMVDGGLNAQEKLQLDSLELSKSLTITQGTLQTLSGVLYAIPDTSVGTCNSVKFGGTNLGHIMDAASAAVGAVAGVNATNGQMASIKGGYARRREEWQQQLDTANIELRQIDQQILGAQIRQAVAEMELRNHKVQRDNAREMDQAMREKFTNEDLYEWMTSELSFTYFQAYKLALEVARRAERCYRHELGLEASDFIRPAYWDSLKKGLLSGEQLMFDIKRMEASYLDKNKRHLELTKHISLATLFPDALAVLKHGDPDTGAHTCTISVPEWLYDMDYPGHHLRRIKSVAISIPCVAGPYTTVSCKLSLVSSKYRKSGIMAGDYTDDENFRQLYGSIQSIATSHAQNDSGLFELSFRDERYLPFEGAGAISDWRIELPAVYAQFDYSAISDVILHVHYTALDEGGLKEDAVPYVKDMLAGSEPEGGFYRMLSLKQEFGTEWQAYRNAFAADSSATLNIALNEGLFPYYAQRRAIAGFNSDINATLILVPKPDALPITTAADYKVALFGRDDDGDGYAKSITLTACEEDGHLLYYIGGTKLEDLTISRNVKQLKLALQQDNDLISMAAEADDIILILHCSCSEEETEREADDADWEMTFVSNSWEERLATPVLAASAANGQVALSWEADAAAGSYMVEQSDTSSFASILQTLTTNGSSMIINAVNGQKKYYRIKATGTGFADSRYSNTVAITPVAGGLLTPVPSLAAGNGQVTLTWSAINGATGYMIKKNGVVLTTVTGTSYTVTGLTNGTAYAFAVIAQGDDVADSAPGTVTGTPVASGLATPAPGLTVGNGQVALSWNAINGATGYVIKKDGNTLNTVTGTSYIVTGLTNGTSYTFAVIAQGNGMADSAPGIVTGIPVGSVLAAPALIFDERDGEIRVSWSNVANAMSYELSYSTNSTFPVNATTKNTYTFNNVPVTVSGTNDVTMYFKIRAMATGYGSSDYTTSNGTPHTASMDADAASYLAALSANATPTSSQQAVLNSFFRALKRKGIYSKMVAVYLPVFSNAAAGGWNLVNPVNSNAAHYMTFHGGNTFTTNGFYGDGSTGYANPHIDLNLAGFTEDNIHLSGYQSTGTLVNADIWTNQLGGYNLWSILPGLPNGNAYFYEAGAVHYIGSHVQDSAGLTLGNSGATGVELYRNGSFLTSVNTPNVPGNPQNGMFVNGSMLNTNTIKFLSIGRALVENPGLNKTEVTDFSQAVANLMAAI